MATSYKTPGVYVEEIPLFPPSIAQVETAVPAFIGYTQRATLNGRDLKLEPTKITSLAEYEEAFGVGPKVEVEAVTLDLSGNVTAAALKSGFLLYDSLRLFYANGGSKCVIISIGAYPAATSDATIADFQAGLAALRKEDEPTLILFPDAVLLDGGQLYALQQQALMQCADLGDRFTILDLYPTSATVTLDDQVEDFRDKIGIQNLSYGAAYVPYLKTNLSKTVSFRHIRDKIRRNNVAVPVTSLTSDSAAQGSIAQLENAISDVDELEGLIGTDGVEAFEATYAGLDTAFKAAVNDPAASLDSQRTAYRALLVNIIETLKAVPDTLVTNTGGRFSSHTPAPGEKKQRYVIDDALASVGSGALFQAASVLNSLAEHAGRVGTAGQATEIQNAVDVDSFTSDAWGSFAEAGDAEDFYPTDPSGLTGDALTSARRDNLRAGAVQAGQVMKTVVAGISALESSAAGYETAYEAALVATFPLLKTILRRTQTAVTELPPSGAMAGVYSKIDATRGVFKAPANVSLSGEVTGVTTLISHDEQADLNVDVVAGKSINAIRPFTGKGILVWGARTLAGNDNEWRYISVRRFFNMVEESTKKETERFVFEPNDANTWMKVKTMIENFLINQWRGGALAGAKPEDAFFVKVGLGQTMTAQDVLEGRMIVEIGMAAVRPAEFIILRFSHKMQQS